MIRYDKKFMSEIRRTVSNYNRKVSRLEKKGDFITPPKVSISELKENYINRKDLRYRLRQLQKFSQRGIEKTIVTKAGAKTSQYELIITKQNIRRAKYNITRKIRIYGSITPKIGGKLQSRTLAQMGDSTLTNLRAKMDALTKGPLEKLTQDKLRKLTQYSQMQVIKLSMQDEMFKENYLKGIDDAVSYGAIEQGQADRIKALINKMPAKNFYEMYKNEKDFEVMLSGHRIDTKAKVLSMNEYEYQSFETDLQAGFEHIENDIERLIQDYT